MPLPSDPDHLIPRSDPDLEGRTMMLDRMKAAGIVSAEAEEIAAAWAGELDQIISRMQLISEEQIGPALPQESRPEAILVLAQLFASLTSDIVAKRHAEIGDGPLTADAERNRIASAAGQVRIEYTARIIAERVWNKQVAEWRRRWPLIVESEPSTRPNGKLILPDRSAPPVRKNHYSPVFANKYWAENGRVRKYSRQADSTIRVEPATARGWGFKDFMYSHKLESYLGLIDSDGAASYKKILDLVPLSELDKRRWIAFLLIQLMRTPRFMRSMVERMRRKAPQIVPGFPTTPGSLRAVFETLFTNNQMYARGYKLMAARTWTVLRAPAAAWFIRPDNPVLVSSRTAQGTWTLWYPMTPEHVFRIGPELGSGYEQDFVPFRTVDAREVGALNAAFAANASKSVIGRTDIDDTGLRMLLAKHLARHAVDDSGEELWGLAGE